MTSRFSICVVRLLDSKHEKPGGHQIQTVGHLGPPQMAVGHLRRRPLRSKATRELKYIGHKFALYYCLWYYSHQAISGMATVSPDQVLYPDKVSIMLGY